MNQRVICTSEVKWKTRSRSESDGVAYMAPFVDSERPTIFRTLLRRPQPDEKFRPPEYDSPNRRRQR